MTKEREPGVVAIGKRSDKDPSDSFFASHIFVACVFVTVFCICLGAIVSPMIRELPNNGSADCILEGQAANLAKAGLADATNWLRRQPRQPVEQFKPSRRDSEDPRIGLVHEYCIAEGVWGRFEVWSDPARAASILGVNPALADISHKRGYETGSGQVWRLACVGYVYRLVDARVPFNRPPNQVLGQEILQTEVGRLRIRLPGQAALCARAGGNVMIGGMGEVHGGADAVGILCRRGRGGPSIDRGRIGGTSPFVTLAPSHYADSVRQVFGVTEPELFEMADHFFRDPKRVPVPACDGTLVCVHVPDLIFTRSRPLKGMGVLYVHGDLTIEAGSASEFRGLIYVDGNLTLRGPAELRGAVLVTRTALIQGSGGPAAIYYDDNILEMVRRLVCTYRAMTPIHRPGVAVRTSRYLQK